METGIYVKGEFKPLVGKNQLCMAMQEVRRLLATGLEPQYVDVWWYEDGNLYHDIHCIDGTWWHNFEQKKIEHIKCPI